jgi:hypothetical protein
MKKGDNNSIGNLFLEDLKETAEGAIQTFDER